ncbi:uncharacterized protein LOC132758161 [Ruditapes philippinarum]|uniref:uncharacterized protein LOC132758161 n=1 Tax=Ruditapes philippinarum TaxID=129788 RepID=UPI00295BD7F6|nr:uncharacterized protein LOC132758161 [Ruditapes philippinarum]
MTGITCVLFLLLLTFTSAAEYDDPDCIVDKSLEPYGSNYMDCSTDLQVQMGRTECCKIDDAVGCCEPGGNWKQFRLIGICLGVITVTLAAFLIYWFWCRKNKRVSRATDYVAQKVYVAQERYCSCIRCCRKQVEARKHHEVLKQKAEEIPAFQLPAESSNSDQTFDKFWQGPIVKS